MQLDEDFENYLTHVTNCEEQSQIPKTQAKILRFGAWIPQTADNQSDNRNKKQPERVLDAPDHNVIDWGRHNLVAIALGKTVYLWKADTGDVNELCSTGETDICAVRWSESQKQKILAIGLCNSSVQIWDCQQCRLLRTLVAPIGLCGSLSWKSNVLSAGLEDGSIFNWDVTQKEALQYTLHGHAEKVCGLSWSPDKTQLASGGNDNLVNIWDSRNYEKPLHEFTAHQSAVKALAWSRWQSGLLASGGGTSDRTIRIWNTISGLEIGCIDAGSQVCALEWSRNDKQLVSSLGFPIRPVTVWSYPDLKPAQELEGHAGRVLFMTLSPDGTMIMTGSSDETIKIWKVFKSASEVGGSNDPARELSKFTGMELKNTAISFR
ncbi:MAG: putative Anaphase-promoting complex subunit cdc20 [Streblomastix strix]|uniref:Putative Anaphase-promoting complex subunit cdc20 n=1 Tax=Streblomastix strix TaxID=222440 RepID=A0A5J4WF73_9EUKA|nr:MAG: putative Anaphase-promoting complex subunit cdc20 [Streblomastix strix]